MLHARKPQQLIESCPEIYGHDSVRLKLGNYLSTAKYLICMEHLWKSIMQQYTDTAFTEKKIIRPDVLIYK